MIRLTTCLVCLAAVVAFDVSFSVMAQAQQPNVILMMADDLAVDDLSCYGSQRIRTPKLDALAAQGVRLTGFYSGNPVCSPSRMALLSGSYPARLGWRWGVLGYGFAPKTGMSQKVYTIAEAFRDAGYRTAISGKWHLGVQNMSPENQGFDSAYYIHMSNNQNRDMYRDGKLVKQNWDNRRLTETFAQEAIRVIQEDSDKPFFLYVPWSAPHFPAEAHPDWQDKSGKDAYTDVVEEMDFRIGQILDALDKAGKADTTIVIFSSDNGRQPGQSGKNEKPTYSGMKWHSLEGGTRVPCIVRYPGQIKAGQTMDAMFAGIDLYPTLAGACGVEIKLPDGSQKMDGKNLWSMLVGGQSADAAARSELLYWHGKGQATAIRVGDWKLFFNTGDKGDPDVSNGPLLYNLKDDGQEKHNLADKHPDKVQAMLVRAKQLLTEIYANQMRIGTWPGVEPPDKPLMAEEVWGQWIRN